MGFIKVFLFQILFLATVSLLLAEESNSTASAGVPGAPDQLVDNGQLPDGVDPQHKEENKFFFNLFPRFTSCNYTLQPGANCATCTQAVTCLSGNIGIVRNCHGLFRYCNNGYCSLFQSAACSNSTSG